ncbi:UNVERIFIED_CONTAM: hypothetical protein Sindi_3098600, partial [Sesamum indicum]
MPWLIMGDFNCVKSPNEKQLGVAPSWYELKDFVDCCTALGLHDVPTTGCYYTWYSNNESNPVWCKLDRSFATMHGLRAVYIAVPISIHRDASPTTLRLLVEANWNLNVDGTAQFCLCKRLKALKGELKAFNSQHYSHISARAKEADHTLQVAQNQLESNPGDVALRNSLGDLRKRAVFLAEAER